MFGDIPHDSRLIKFYHGYALTLPFSLLLYTEAVLKVEISLLCLSFLHRFGGCAYKQLVPVVHGKTLF